MVKCSFCSTSKSEKYLYTACGHFICLNCAALRTGQTLKCCDKHTIIDEQVKYQLQRKKQLILTNLDNGYEYQKTNLERMTFDQIEKNLRRIDQSEHKKKISQRISQEQNCSQQDQQTKQQMLSTPIDLLYNNPFVLRNKKYKNTKNIKNTPIKLLTNIQDQQKEMSVIESHLFTSFNEKDGKCDNKSPQRKKQRNAHQQNQFIPILVSKIDFVRQQFKVISDELQKMEETIIYQLKIYFEEYIKLVQQENKGFQNPKSSVISQQQRINTFLNQFIQKWKLNQIKDRLRYQKKRQSIRQKTPQKQTTKLILRQNENATNRKSMKMKHVPSNFSKQHQINQLQRIHSEQNLRKYSPIQFQSTQSNEPVKCNTTSRNLDKIYKKLQESRTKLEQRIYKHSYFMSDRCKAMEKA